MAQSTFKIGGALQLGLLASAPANPKQGMIYVNSVDSKIYIYNGTTFNEVQDQALLDAILGTLNATPTNYTPTEATHSGHLQGIDTELGLKAASSVVSEIDQNVDDLIALSGVAENSVDLGTFTGTTISDSTTIKNALQELELAVESAAGSNEKEDSLFRIFDNVDNTKKIAFEAANISNATTRTITMPDTDVNLGDIATNASNISTNQSNISANTSDIADLRTTQGTVDGDLNLGTFTGSTISDNNTVKGALQELETEVELKLNSSEKGAANGVATLDANSKIPSSQLPAIAVTDVFQVADIAARDALVVGTADGEVQEGDVAIVTDASADAAIISGSASYIYSGTAWVLLKSGDDVISVNGQTGTVSLSTTDISEGTNLYFTDARARTAAVVDSTAGNQIDQAASVSSMKTYVNGQISAAGHISNVIEDTTPQLGGDLDVLAQSIESSTSEVLLAGQNSVRRAKQATKSNYIEEEYLHAVSLLASQTGTVIAALNFAHASVDAVEMVYKLKDSLGALRMGTIRVVTDGTNVSINDVSTELGDTSAIQFSAAVNGANVEIAYDSGANTATMRLDIKRMLV